MANSFQSFDKMESLQNIAIKVIKEQERQFQLENGLKERTLLILGSKGVGKTTIINKFFDRDESPRPTLALDYSYGRRSTSGLQKQIFNIWELGSLENSEDLVKIPLNSHRLEHFSVMIILDLSDKSHIWSDLSRAIKVIKNSYFEAKHKNLKEYTDSDTFPLPLIIVGGKYDIFQDFDPEIKKQICIFLRSVSLSLGAALLFHSQKIPILFKTIRDTLSHLGFDSPSNPIRKTLYDYNGPIFVWFGCDSWEKIGITSMTTEMIGINFSNKFPQINQGMRALPDDPAKDSGFSESLIDDMRNQKDEELKVLFNETAIRAKFEVIGL